MDIGLTARLDTPFSETVEQTRKALRAQGFGVLTEIDVRATLREKIDEEIEDYVILGACNPRLAHRALGVDRQVGHELTIDLRVTSNVFLPGHRIRLEVSSSNFPRYDRNTNTGGTIATDSEDDLAVAVNRVHHGPTYPSRLVLPLIERTEAWS